MYNMYNQMSTLDTNNNDKIEISDDTRIYIIDKLVEPYYKNIIKNTIDGRSCWRKSGIAFETISKIMVAFGSILSFSAGFYHDETLSFISGSISCLSLAFLQLSSFSYKENKKQSEELNILLKKLKLDTIPVFERQADTQMRQYQSSRAMPMPMPKPYKPYNPYNSYDIFDPANSYENFENTEPHTYLPPEHNKIPIRSLPSISSISKIPKRVSTMSSINNECIDSCIDENDYNYTKEIATDETTNGETTNGETTNGDTTNGETTNGETTTGDTTNGDGTEEETETDNTQNEKKDKKEEEHKPNFIEKTVKFLFS